MESPSIDTAKPLEAFITEIECLAINQRHAPGLPLAPFASLLVRLSQEATLTADKNLIIQKRIIWLTITILGIAIAQLALGFLQFSASTTNKAQAVIATPKAIQAEAEFKEVQPNMQQPKPSHTTPSKP